MERRKALLTAGAVAGTLFAAGTTLAVSGGILDLRTSDGAGTLTPVVAGQVPASPVTGDPSAVAGATPAPIVVLPETAPLTRSEASPSVRGEEREEGEEDEYEDHDYEGGKDREAEERQYEGADDDD